MEKTVQAEQAPAAHLKLVFQTEHYKVYVGRIPDMPETPKAMQMKYIVVNEEDGVVLGLAGGRGAAIMAAIGAEQELEKAEEIAKELAARAARPAADGLDFSGGFPN